MKIRYTIIDSFLTSMALNLKVYIVSMRKNIRNASRLLFKPNQKVGSRLAQ